MAEGSRDERKHVVRIRRETWEKLLRRDMVLATRLARRPDVGALVEMILQTWLKETTNV